MNESYLRAHSLIGFCDLVSSHGGNPKLLLEEVGIPLKALTDHDMLIAYRCHAMLMEIAARRLERPSFGLEWARSVAP
ncbi:MAG: AraC family transcriptional regulator ligand-binding domain-containing protein, partial [Pseudomonadales bacterium]